MYWSMVAPRYRRGHALLIDQPSLHGLDSLYASFVTGDTVRFMPPRTYAISSRLVRKESVSLSV